MSNYEQWQLAKYGNVLEETKVEETEVKDTRLEDFFELEIVQKGEE